MTSLAHHWKEEGIQQGMQIGEAKGMQIGRNEGMQIGRNEGKYERTVEVAKNMYNAGSDIAFISKVTGLSISELNNLLKPKS